MDFDSPERERQLDAFALEAMHRRKNVVETGVSLIARAIMVNDPNVISLDERRERKYAQHQTVAEDYQGRAHNSNIISLDERREQKQALAQIATNNVVDDKEPLSA